MRRITTFLLLISYTIGYCQQEDFRDSSEKDYKMGKTSTAYEGIKNEDFKNDKKGVYYKDSLVFKNSLSDEEFSIYSYLGEHSDKYIIMCQNYNGNHYYIYNIKDKRQINLEGRPFFFNKYIVTVNEDETTDNINYVTIWCQCKNTIKKVSTIRYSIYPIIDVRINEKDSCFYFKNSNNEYKKLKIPRCRLHLSCGGNKKRNPLQFPKPTERN
jgi:hypothetical protein